MTTIRRALIASAIAVAATAPVAGLANAATTHPTAPTAAAAYAYASASASASASTSAHVVRHTVRLGSYGNEVEFVQHALWTAGHRVSLDGRFGPKTRAAVIAFQKEHRLVADGIVGPKTWRLLDAILPDGA